MFGLREVHSRKDCGSGELRRWLFGRIVSCSGDVLGALRKRTRGAKGLGQRLAGRWNELLSHYDDSETSKDIRNVQEVKTL